MLEAPWASNCCLMGLLVLGNSSTNLAGEDGVWQVTMYAKLSSFWVGWSLPFIFESLFGFEDQILTTPSWLSVPNIKGPLVVGFQTMQVRSLPTSCALMWCSRTADTWSRMWISPALVPVYYQPKQCHRKAMNDWPFPAKMTNLLSFLLK